MKKSFFGFLLIVFLWANPIFAKEKIEVKNPRLGVWVLKIDTKKYGNKIKPFVAKRLTTPQKIYDDNCFDLVVNGGFFDVKTGRGASYVVIDGELKEDVEANIKLRDELKAQDRLEKVLSRAELRILETKRNKLKFDIALHTDTVPKKYKIKHSLQAGPMLLPNMDLVGEGFVVMENGLVKSQSVDILKRRERTALGLKGKYLYIVLFTKDYKVDANEMRDYLKKELRLKKVMALDGGLSTAINHKDITIGSFGKYQRRVKSFLVVER